MLTVAAGMQSASSFHGTLSSERADSRLSRSSSGRSKISPDESFKLIQNIAEMIESSTLTGLIISNTTLSRDGIQDKDQHIKGGLSGAPLMNKSTKILNLVNNNYPNLALIGVGGVMSKSDFDKKIHSGALLVQIYTGFIIKGPKIVMEILK